MSTVLQSRVGELTDYALSQYGIPPVQMRILASICLPTRYAPVWILAGADQHPFWDDLSFAMRRIGQCPVYDTTEWRAIRPYFANRLIDDAVYDRHHKAAVIRDAYWRDGGNSIPPTSHYPMVVSQSVRMKIELNPSKFPDDDSNVRLERLMRGVLFKDGTEKVEWNTPFAVPTPPNDELEEYIKVVAMTDPLLTEESALTRNICFIPALHGLLMDRKPQRQDYLAQYEVVRNAIPALVEGVLKVLIEQRRYVSVVMLNHLASEGKVRRVVRGLTRTRLLERSGLRVRVNPEVAMRVRALFDGSAEWWD